MPAGLIGNDGSFHFANVEPGDYRVLINPLNTPGPGLLYPVWFYPGVATRDRAEVIHIERGTDLVLPTAWILPPAFVERKIEGVFVWLDGEAAAGVRYVVRDVESGHVLASRGESSGPDGRVESKVLHGRRYRVEAPGYSVSAEIGPDFAGNFVVKLMR
jgi:hypothetical protein